MTIIEVNSKKSIQQFHQLPFQIYKSDKNWIPHIQQEVEAVFTPKQNKFFRHGEAIRWILKDSDGKIIGRIALLSIVKKHLARNKLPVDVVFSNASTIKKLLIYFLIPPNNGLAKEKWKQWMALSILVKEIATGVC